MFYLQSRTILQKLYYNFRSRSDATVNFFPFIESKELHYISKYLLLNEFYKALHPFQFIEPCFNVIQVGCESGYIDKGFSHPLILSSLVGPKGHVLVIEPSRSNISELAAYIRKNSISNISIIEGALWKESTKLEILLVDNKPTESVALPIAKKAGIIDPKNKNNTILVETFTLDYIISKYCNNYVDFINLTTNGAELEILQGAKNLFKSDINTCISLALSNRNHYSYNMRLPALKYLISEGYKIAIADAPHDPWKPIPFLFACAVKCKDNKLLEMGFSKNNWQDIVKETGI